MVFFSIFLQVIVSKNKKSNETKKEKLIHFILPIHGKWLIKIFSSSRLPFYLGHERSNSINFNKINQENPTVNLDENKIKFKLFKKKKEWKA